MRLQQRSQRTIAVHPNNDRIVVIAEAETRTSRCSVHVSTGAGASWAQGTSPQPAAAPGCVRNTEGPISDLVFSPDGTLFYAFPGWRLDDSRRARTSPAA